MSAEGGSAARDAAWHWVASWSCAQQIPEPENTLPPPQLEDATLRQIVRTSLGGETLRVRLSNLFGTAPLHIGAAQLARSLGPGQAKIDVSSSRVLRFAGRSEVTIAAGAEVYCDPMPFAHVLASDLAISLYLPEAPARQTSHPGSRATSFVVKGNHAAAAHLPGAGPVLHWYQLADLEVQAPAAVGVLVAIGDSITDGRGSTTDGNDRWTDQLAQRLARERTPMMGVVNAGLGGNRMLRDGLGPSLVSRFDRDVLARSGVTDAVVLAGINDLGTRREHSGDSPAERARLVDALTAALRDMAERGHAQHVCMIGATLSPYMGHDGYQPTAADETDRQALNAWIRTSGIFDAIADFDLALRDPDEPQRMRAELHSGDHLHPSPAGYRAMAEAVPLAALTRRC